MYIYIYIYRERERERERERKIKQFNVSLVYKAPRCYARHNLEHFHSKGDVGSTFGHHYFYKPTPNIQFANIL